MTKKSIPHEVKKFMDPRWGTPDQINPAEREAQRPGVPEGWPMEARWPKDKRHVCGEWLDCAEIDKAFAGWKKGDPIGYIKDKAPAFSLPDYSGERYEALVPDTLDIQERAAIGIHALTELTDPDADYSIYGDINFTSNPPVMLHTEGDNQQPKWVEALVLCRLISGSLQNMHVEEKWLETMLRMQGPDGLLYWPSRGRPWYTIFNTMTRHIPKDQAACPFEIGRFLVAITAYYRLTGEEVWLETGKRIVDGLRSIALEVDDYAYHPKWYFGLGERVTPAMAHWEENVPHLHGAGWVVDGLGKFYQATGYEPARDLGEKMTRYLMKRMARVDNRHFHTNTQSLIGMLELAMVTADQEVLEFCQEHFEFLKMWGNGLLGFFPEMVGPLPDYRGAESCEVAGMIIAGLKLTELDVADHWDDVDRWVRNQFAEAQLLRSDYIRRFPMKGFGPIGQPSLIDERYMTTERVTERVVGSFTGNAYPNDFFGLDLGLSPCCLGNGNRAWYHIWENILHYDEGKLQINLLLNRASQWADVDSHLPYSGRVDVKIKRPVALSVRIPAWVIPRETRVQVNGKDRTVEYQGRYAKVGSVKPDDVVSVMFPICEQPSTQWIQGDRFDLVLKGNEVVLMEPSGEKIPLYQRSHYRVEGTRWRKIERFIADKLIYH